MTFEALEQTERQLTSRAVSQAIARSVTLEPDTRTPWDE
jgi:hypothetical protein